jgi:hypothetical protein
VATRKISRLEKIRKANLNKAIKYRIAAKAKKKASAQRAIDSELVQKWRALRKIGAYSTKENPALSRLTKYRREEIKRKFERVQDLTQYEDGESYQPFHKHTYKKTTTKFNQYGQVVKKSVKEHQRYELDTDHFQMVKGKAKQTPSGSIKTNKGLLVAKSPNEKIKITKDGTVKIEETKNKAKTIFTRIPLSGALDFIKLMDDIENGRLKFKKNEGLKLENNGRPNGLYYGKNVMNLVRLMKRYMGGALMRHNGGKGNFDDWADNSEISFIRGPQ